MTDKIKQLEDALEFLDDNAQNFERDEWECVQTAKQALQQSLSIAKGKKVAVPVDASEEMCRAGESCDGGSSTERWLGDDYTPENVELIYKAMIERSQNDE